MLEGGGLDRHPHIRTVSLLILSGAYRPRNMPGTTLCYVITIDTSRGFVHINTAMIPEVYGVPLCVWQVTRQEVSRGRTSHVIISFLGMLLTTEQEICVLMIKGFLMSTETTLWTPGMTTLSTTGNERWVYTLNTIQCCTFNPWVLFLLSDVLCKLTENVNGTLLITIYNVSGYWNIKHVMSHNGMCKI